MRRLLLLSVAVVSWAVGGCRDPAGPIQSKAPILYGYRLGAIGGQTLPYPLAGRDAPSRILDGILYFHDDGTFDLLLAVGTDVGYSQEESGRYTRADDWVTLTYPDRAVVGPIQLADTLLLPPEPRPPGGGAFRALRAAGSLWTYYEVPTPCTLETCGSCPLVYAWDGADWHLDSGTFAGAITPGWARTDVTVLAHAAAVAGRLRLRMTDELYETEHVDAVQVVAVDHARRRRVVPDAAGGVHVLVDAHAPLAARDRDGRDLAEVLARADGRVWESAERVRDPTLPVSLRDAVELTFERPAGAQRAWLIVHAQNTPWAVELLHRFVDAQGAAVHAWYAATRLPGVGAAFERRLAREGFLHVSLAAGDTWTEQGSLREVGPEVMKAQAVPLDLGNVVGNTVRVRLEGPPSVWRVDAAELALEQPGALPGAAGAGRAEGRDESGAAESLPLIAARMRDRSVGDVLATVDGRRLTMERGDTVELLFAAPPPRAGLERTYLLRSTGWYRIHSRSSGLPDLRTLARIATDRDGMARLAAEWSNARIRGARLMRR